MTELTEILATLKNQRKTDKFSLGYIINAIMPDYFNGDSYKRQELLDKLTDLITTNPRALNNLCDLQTYFKYKSWAQNLPCVLKNSRGGVIIIGSYIECKNRKNLHINGAACRSISKNWKIEFINNLK